MATKIKLTLEERIDRAKEGRTQTYIVGAVNKILSVEDQLTEVTFSRKKKGFEEFNQNQLDAISQVLPAFEA